MTFRLVVKEVAATQGVHATFMPKPIEGVQGSGMHLHLSLYDGEDNAFYDESDPYSLSLVAKQFMAGLLRHAAEITAITNQTVNSYKRLVPGYEAPIHVSWARNNRSGLVRVPITPSGAARGDPHRVPLPRPGMQSVPRLLGDSRRGHEGGRGGLRTARRGRRQHVRDGRRSVGQARASPRCPNRSTVRAGDGDVGLGARRARRAHLRVVPAQQAVASGRRTRPTSAGFELDRYLRSL